MSITKSTFGAVDGRPVYTFTLDNGNGLQAEILNYGGIVRRLVYKGVDVVLGYEDFTGYAENPFYFGAIIGRNANRIAGSAFTLNGKTYSLFPNKGKHNLHGGKAGFDKKLWTATTMDGPEPTLRLSLVSPDGEEGFPGTVTVQVAYTLTKDNSLQIAYDGETDQDTVLNMTSHAYFNLNGHTGGTIEKHMLFIDSEFYTQNTPENIPTGEVHRITGTPLDFSVPTPLTERLSSDFLPIRQCRGLDHNFILRGQGLRKVASCTGNLTGIRMDVYTDKPGMQVYSANMLSENVAGKDGGYYSPYSGICFEPQIFPNATRFSHFPDTVLRKGEKYNSITAYTFI